MISTAWEICVLDNSVLECLDTIKSHSKHYSCREIVAQKTSIGIVNSSGSIGEDDLQSSLVGAEHSCKAFITELDDILKTLDEVSVAHADVTGRTNSLMMNCENLLEQQVFSSLILKYFSFIFYSSIYVNFFQHTLHATVEVLKNTLAPFTEVEEVAGLLGIPVESRGPTALVPTVLQSFAPAKIDPRSPEFKDVLSRLSKAMNFLRVHPEYLDSERYIRWLHQLQHRATSLIACSMRDLLDNASKLCKDVYAKQALVKAQNREEVPLESSPAYQRFRGLGFRMRELGALLRDQMKEDQISASNLGGNVTTERPGQQAMAEVTQAYVIIRTSLLVPILRENTAAALGTTGNGTPVALTGNSNAELTGSTKSPKMAPQQFHANNNLCPGIRQAYAILLRVSQLELQLFESLFKAPSVTTKSSTAATTTASESRKPNGASMQNHSEDVLLDENSSTNSNEFLGNEVLSIVETICGATGDLLRPMVIRETDVDELCRVITTLAEDVRSQMLAMPLPRIILRCMLSGLDLTVSDAQERLAYCAEIKLRRDVQMFDPLPSQLAYPDILSIPNTGAVRARASDSKAVADPGFAEVGTPLNSQAAKGIDDVSRSWYPPLRNTLALLSKLYGVVEMVVFEDFARRGVLLCVQVHKKI